MSFLLKLLTGPLIESIVGIIQKFQDRKLSEVQLKAEVHKELIAAFGKISESQRDVILAEVKAEDRLTRLWRPISALLFVFIIVFYSLLLPVLVDWFGLPPVRIGDKLLAWVYELVTICLGGYIAGRSLEKIVEVWKR